MNIVHHIWTRTCVSNNDDASKNSVLKITKQDMVLLKYLTEFVMSIICDTNFSVALKPCSSRKTFTASFKTGTQNSILRLASDDLFLPASEYKLEERPRFLHVLNVM
jgi:hypothetical protein